MTEVESIRPHPVFPVSDIASGGYSVIGKRLDGGWSTGLPGAVESTLAKLHADKNESFSVFREGGIGGILWIELAAPK
ncbi:MAG TPA: hypothetical protein DDZ88_12090 [Verrucomicrobiales bacterium]|nr:hypothetical protein [Verrucomicrobiales bacterium]